MRAEANSRVGALAMAAASALVCLCLAPPLEAQESQPKIALRKQSLAFPIAVVAAPGKPAPTLECVVTFGPPIPRSALAFGPDGKTLAVGGYQDVAIWNLEKAELSKRVGAGELTGTVQALAFLDGGRLLAAADGTPQESGAVKVFDLAKGDVAFTLDEPEEIPYCLALSPGGEYLAAGGADSRVHVWSTKERKRVAAIDDHDDWVFGLSFSRDGKFLATAGADRALLISETGTWKRVRMIQQADAAQGCAFSPDGRFVAVAVGGPNEWAVRIQGKDNPRQRRAIYTGRGMPLDVVWSPRGNKIYVAASDGTVQVFQASGRRLATFSGHADWVYSVALSVDDKKLASGSADGTVKLWSTAEGRLLATLVQLAPRSDQWLIIAPQGYLTTSSPSALRWKTENLTTPPAELTGLLQSPESVRKAIAGQKTASPAVR